MALSDIGYDSQQSAQLIKDFQFDTANIFTLREQYRGSGVFGLSAGSSTFTPATSPSWTDDEFISLAAKNLLFVDDDGDPCFVKIDDNDSDSVTFDEAAAFKVSDPTTTASLTNTDTYNFVVYSKHDSNQYGNFLGYTKEDALTPLAEYVPFMDGLPEKKIRQDLSKKEIALNGKLFSNDHNTEAAIWGMDEYGSKAGEYSQYGYGSKDGVKGRYLLTLQMFDVDSREKTYTLLSVEFRVDGSVEFTTPEHKGYSFIGDGYAEPLFPDTVNYMISRRYDAAA